MKLALLLRMAYLVVPALGLVTMTGCQQLEQDLGLGGGSTSGGVDAGPLGSVCCGGTGSCSDGLSCCETEGAACDSDYECCGGLCSGASDDGMGGTTSGTCVSSGNTACSAALGSRCTSKSDCACTTDDDCCQENTGAVCTNSSVTTEGKRCCLNTGIPCGGNGDCCSGSCDATQAVCD